MNLQENIRRILKEESLKQTLLDEIMRSGIRDTANIMSVDVKELLELISMLLSKLGGGLIRGHYLYVYNTGDC